MLTVAAPAEAPVPAAAPPAPTYEQLLQQTKEAAKKRKSAVKLRLQLLDKTQKEATRFQYQETERSLLAETQKSFREQQERSLSRDGVINVAELPTSDGVALMKDEIEKAAKKADAANKAVHDLREQKRLKEKDDRRTAWEAQQAEHQRQVLQTKKDAKDQWRAVEKDTEQKAQDRARMEAVMKARNRDLAQERLAKQAKEYADAEKAAQLDRQRSLKAQSEMMKKHQKLALMERQQMLEGGREIQDDRHEDMEWKRQQQREAERRNAEWRRVTGARKREALKAKVAEQAAAKAAADADAKERFEASVKLRKERDAAKAKEERKAVKAMHAREKQLKEEDALKRKMALDAQAEASRKYMESFTKEADEALARSLMGDDLEKQLATQQRRDLHVYEQNQRNWNARAHADRAADETKRREVEFQSKQEVAKMQASVFKQVKAEQAAALAHRIEREKHDAAIKREIARQEQRRIDERNDRELRAAQEAAIAEKRRKARVYDLDMMRRFKKEDEEEDERHEKKKMTDELWKEANELRSTQESAEKEAIRQNKLLFRTRAKLKSKEDLAIRQKQKLDKELVEAAKAQQAAMHAEEELKAWTERADSAAKDVADSKKTFQLLKSDDAWGSNWFKFF